jgi:hypothetical protein
MVGKDVLISILKKKTCESQQNSVGLSQDGVCSMYDFWVVPYLNNKDWRGLCLHRVAFCEQLLIKVYK